MALAPAADASADAPDRTSSTGPLPVVRSRSTAWLMTILGAVALAASIALVLERLAVALDPEHVPSCTLNPVLTCTSVMLSEQASVFGFPNPLLGVAGFSVVVTSGVAMLADARMRAWFWTGMWVGTLLGVVFVHWLIVQSLVSIQALCLYCMVVWVMTVPLFAAVSAYAVPRGALGRRLAASTLVGDLLALRWWLVGLWYVVLVALVGIAFWDYWSTLL